MAKRPTRKAKSNVASNLAEALNFVSPVTNDDGDFDAHCRLAGQVMTATNGVFSAGHPIEEELVLCPHIGRFVDAVNKTGSSLTLVQNDNGTLLVKGDKLRATVPCISGDQIPPAQPDPNVAVIDDRIKEGFAKLLPLIDHEGDRVIEVSILLQANSMYSTNGFIVFEFWHGIDLPPGLVVSKAFAKAVAACSKPLVGFGFSARSVTFYFEGGAWYKSQLYGEAWPDASKLFDYPVYPAPVPEGLFDAVKAIENFSADGLVHFHGDKLKSTYDKYNDRSGVVYGATYDVPGLQSGHTFTARLLKTIEPVCVQLDYTSNNDRAFFFDATGNLRGSLMKCGASTGDPAPDVDSAARALSGYIAAAAQEASQALQEAAKSGWGVPVVPDAIVETPAPVDAPFDPWAGIVGNWQPGKPAIYVEDDDIPF